MAAAQSLPRTRDAGPEGQDGGDPGSGALPRAPPQLDSDGGGGDGGGTPTPAEEGPWVGLRVEVRDSPAVGACGPGGASWPVAELLGEAVRHFCARASVFGAGAGQEGRPPLTPVVPLPRCFAQLALPRCGLGAAARAPALAVLLGACGGHVARLSLAGNGAAGPAEVEALAAGLRPLAPRPPPAWPGVQKRAPVADAAHVEAGGEGLPATQLVREAFRRAMELQRMLYGAGPPAIRALVLSGCGLAPALQAGRLARATAAEAAGPELAPALRALRALAGALAALLPPAGGLEDVEVEAEVAAALLAHCAGAPAADGGPQHLPPSAAGALRAAGMPFFGSTPCFSVSPPPEASHEWVAGAAERGVGAVA
jgi:hypothetical protein